MSRKTRLQDRLPLAQPEPPLSVELINALEARCKALVFAEADELKKLYQNQPIESLRVQVMAGHRSYFDAARTLLKDEQP